MSDPTPIGETCTRLIAEALLYSTTRPPADTPEGIAKQKQEARRWLQKLEPSQEGRQRT